VATTSPPAGATNAEIVRWTIETLNRRDVASLRSVWTDETVERFPDRTCRGADETAAYFEEAFAAISDWRMEVIAIAEQGDDVFLHWRLTGKHTGTLLGIEATGKALAIDGMDHFVIREGRIVTNFVVFDQMQYARQIGMMPADGSGADRTLKLAFNARTELVKRLRG
jgi:steroid delta-isomerase-like uncharacterized protein